MELPWLREAIESASDTFQALFSWEIDPEEKHTVRDDFRELVIFLKESLTLRSPMWPHWPSQATLIVESIRKVGAAVVANNPGNAWPIFAEMDGVAMLVEAVMAYPTPWQIREQAWQTLAMLAQNLRGSALTAFLRAPALQRLFSGTPELEGVCFDYHLSLMRTLSLRISPDTAGAFAQSDFALMQKAVDLSCHKDCMVRTTARTSYMTLLKIQDEHVQQAAMKVAKTSLLPLLAQLLMSQWKAAVQAVEDGKKAAIRNLLEDEEETLSHFGELMNLGIVDLNAAICQLLGRTFLRQMGSLVQETPQWKLHGPESPVYQDNIVPLPGSLVDSPRSQSTCEPSGSSVTHSEEFGDGSRCRAATPGLEQALTARAIASFCRAMREAQVPGVVTPLLELLLMPAVPAGLVQFAVADCIASPKEVAKFLDELTAALQEDLAIEAVEASAAGDEQLRCWQINITGAPGWRFGANDVPNPFRRWLLDTLDAPCSSIFECSRVDLFSFQSLADEKLAALAVVQELDLVYPSLRTNPDFGLVPQPRMTVKVDEKVEEEENFGFFSMFTSFFEWADPGRRQSLLCQAGIF